MKIRFLGCGHGVPEVDRFCSCAVIEVGESLYLIDAGAPAADLLTRYGYNFNNLRAFFNTHSHSDHLTGVISLVDLIHWYHKKASLDLYLPEEAPKNAIINYISSLYDTPPATDRLHFHVFDESFVYQDENIKVSAFPTMHLKRAASARPAYGFVIEADRKRVVFSGDLSNRLTHQDFPKIALEEEVDLLICEMAHFNISDITPYLEKCKAKEIWFNHIGYTEPVENIAALDGKFGYSVKIAHDGDLIEL